MTPVVLGAAPSQVLALLECLLLAGHAGVSTDAGAAILGFNPDAGGLAAWQVVYGLRSGDAFPGIVTDDTGVFTAVRQHGVAVEAFEVDRTETNKATAWGAKLSETFDLTKEDAADDLLFNEVIWRSVKGPNAVMPAPVRAAFWVPKGKSE